VKIALLGAALEITASYYLFEPGAVRFLVDCGTSLDEREASGRNRRLQAERRLTVTVAEWGQAIDP